MDTTRRLTSTVAIRAAAALMSLAFVTVSCARSGAPRAAKPTAGATPATTVASPSIESGPSSRQADEQPLPDGDLLHPGARYRAAGQLQDIDVTFTAPSTPLYGFAARRFVGISTDEAGVEMILAVLPEAGLRVFPSPDIEPGDLTTVATFGAVTADAPADIVAWLADRPFLEAGPIDEAMRAGALTGRGFSYEVGELSPLARACGSDASHRCAATVWANGIMFHLAPGERGRILQVDVAGQPVLVMIRDEPATAPLLSALRLDVVPTPEKAGHATRLPYFTPALDPGTRYYIDKIASDVGLLLTAPPQHVTASQREDVAWFGDPAQPPTARHYYLTALDATTVVANTDPSLDPYAILGPGGIDPDDLHRFLRRTMPLPADPVGWLTQQRYVDVEQPAHDEQVAGHRARVADVRAARLHDGIACPDREGACAMPFTRVFDAFPIVISSEYVTRVIDLTVGDHRILIAADLGTPGETLLDSLAAFVLHTTET